MGHIWWGSPMQKMNGFYEYSVSPYQQKPFKGMLTPGFGNWIKRTARQAVFIAPPLAFYYYLHIWADKKYEYYNRKEYLRTVEADE